MRDVIELDRFAGEHLTATALMVELQAPLSSTMRALEARRYLDDHDFDVALVEGERLKVITRARLQRLNRPELGRPIAELADSPRRDRLIERTLPIREVARKLAADSEPLLIVGNTGVTHIVTVADFAGVAGTAVVLSFVLTIDQALNELLLGRRDEAWSALTPKEREEAKRRQSEAANEGAALDALDYLGMGSRLSVLRKLRLHTEFGLGTREDHELLRKARNATAHGTLSDPKGALNAIDVAESMLRRLSEVLVSWADEQEAA